jgi:tripartite-type tricarboxylate transporter receptor subunit TctC
MRFTKLLLAGALAVQATFAVAQAWPTKPIRLIIGFPPGGGADGVARPVAEALSRELGQPVIVENRPGAGTTIAASAAATAAPDGYTLFMHNSSIYGSLQAVFKDYRFQPKDFTPISRWTTGALVVAVPSTLPVKTLEELIAMARAQPGKLNYASSGVGGGTHLPALLFVNAARLDMVHVPYKGGAPALQGVAAGETQITFATPPSALPLVKGGKLKLLAVTTAQRSKLFPELPTVAESGVPGYEYPFWFGLFGPAGLPEPIVARLFEASRKVLTDPELVKRLEATGNEATPSESVSEFRAWAAKDGALNAELTIASGAKAE